MLKKSKNIFIKKKLYILILIRLFKDVYLTKKRAFCDKQKAQFLFFLYFLEKVLFNKVFVNF